MALPKRRVRPINILTLEGRILIGFGVALGVLVSIAVLSNVASARFRENSKSVAHTHEVLVSLEALLSLVRELEASRRGFILTSSPELRSQFDRMSRELTNRVVRVRVLTSDNPKQQESLYRLEPLLSTKLEQMRSSLALWDQHRAKSMNEQVLFTERGALLATEIAGIVQQMRAEEEGLLRLRNASVARAETLSRTVVNSGGALAIALVSASVWLILRDVSARHAAEQMLAASNSELKAFAYTVSHDLKAPLRGISGYAQEMQKRHSAQLSDRGRFCAQQIVTATRNLDLLIEDLLAYAKIAGEAPVFTELNIRDLIDKVLKTYQQQIAERKVHVGIDVPFETVTAWQRGLEQALSNILDNAIKYSRQSSQPTVTIQGKETATEYVISVQDNGVGFSPEYKERIFGLFNRLVRSEDFEGTGAGLAITRRLLEKQNARIVAEGELNKGAKFNIHLRKTMKS